MLENLTLFRTKNSENKNLVWDNTLNFITLFRTKDEMHALLFQSHLSFAITSKFTLWSLLLYTWSTYPIHLANQLCRQYPVDRLTQNYTLFRTGYIVSFPRERNLFRMQHKLLISHLLPCSHRSCMSVYCFMFGFVLLLYMAPYFSLKP